MAIFKCKMCGGTLEVNQGESVGVCEYCGTRQTLPNTNDDVIANLYNRANNLRLKSEFDRAQKVYEDIVNKDDSQAEAHWGIVLCKYGIEYVTDPETGKKIPTCHRTSYEAIRTDADYLAAIDYADTAQQAIYEAEAREIDKIQKGILAIAKEEKPFDVFICYKETDETGNRTVDSTIANDIYYQLTQEGFKVFYAAITLEDKLGQEYEPYIFAALNSAKMMLVIGTKPEYFNAVWVKNEWSRYLKLIKNDRSRLLIPCYRDMDAYDLPEEFAHLQAQDMSKIGFISDVVRGIKKVLVKETAVEASASVQTISNESGNANAAPLLERAFMFLEDGKWNDADAYCEKVLDIEPKNAEAYLGKLMAELKIHNKDDLKNEEKPFDNLDNAKKASRFDEALAVKLKADNDFICARIENARKEGIYNEAVAAMKAEEFDKAAKIFESIAGFKDTDALLKQCLEAVEAQKQKASSDAERAKEIVPVLLTGKDYSDKQSSEDSFSDAEQKERQLSALLNDFDSIAEQIKQTEPQIASNEALIKSLTEQRASLGIFAGKEKKRLDEEINAQKDKNASLKKELDALSGRLCGFAKKEDVAKALENAHKYIEAIATLKNDEALANAVTDVLIAGGYYSALGSLLHVSGIFSKGKRQVCYIKIATCRSAFISSGSSRTVGLKKDGTVVATGINIWGECNVTDWKDIVAVSAGSSHTVGLKADGTVVAVGSNSSGECDVSGWKDIVAVAAGREHTVGLKADGTVVATKYTGEDQDDQCNVKDWTDIVAVAAGSYHTVGLKADGTVVATGSNEDGRCNVKAWTNIVAVSAGYYHTVGLKKDGTVVATGDNDRGQCDVKDWKDIVAVAAGEYHTVGLKADGTVVATKFIESTFYKYEGQCDVEGWKDIVAVAAGYDHTVGLKADGTVVATKYTGKYYNGQCDVKGWTDIKSF